MAVNRATLFEMPNFDTKAIYVGFMMDRVAVHSGFLQVFHFFVLVIPTALHTTVLCLWCLTSGISTMQYDAQNAELYVYVMVCHGI